MTRFMPCYRAQVPTPIAGDFLKRPPVVAQSADVQRQLFLLPDGTLFVTDMYTLTRTP